MVRVEDYDPNWPEQFRVIRSRVWPAVSEVAVAIEHVGSTSVPGAVAKPIIDLDIVIPGRAELGAGIARLEQFGYQYCGELGIVDRHAFRAPPSGPIHHLYVCLQGSVALYNHLTLRDHLRTHPADLAAYSALKRRLAADFPNDIDRYVEGKSEFILSILARSGLSADNQDTIRQANRAK